MSFRKAILGAAVIFGLMGLWANPSLGPAWAQNVQCANQPAGNSTNACANTRFVSSAITAICSATPSLCQSLFGYTNAAWYGAVCDGSTNDTTAITAAYTATPTGTMLLIPPGQCLVSGSGSQIFSYTKPVKWTGAGGNVPVSSNIGTTLLIATGTPTNRDLFKIVGTSGASTRGIEFHQFSVAAQSGSVGYNVFNFDSTSNANTSFGDVLISEVNTMPTASAGGYSIFLNNAGSVSTNGGVYNFTVQNSYLGGGIGSVKTGDTIRVINNIIPTANCGIVVDQIGGAGGFYIYGNNITSTEGGVCATGATGLVIDSNIFEQRLTNTEANNSIIDLIGSGTAIVTPKITKNQIQAIVGVGNPTLIRVANASNTVIDQNYLGVPVSMAAIDITASATATLIGNGNICASCSAIATNAGTGTVQSLKTGLTTTLNGIYYNPQGGVGGNSVTTTSAMTDGQLLVGASSAAPAPRTMSGDCTFTTLGAITCTRSNGTLFGTAAFATIGTSGDTVPKNNTANTFSAQQIVSLSNTFAVPLRLESTNDDANSGPFLQFRRSSATPTAGDLLGLLHFQGNNSTPAIINYGYIQAEILDPTAASEDGRLNLAAVVGGAITVGARLGAGLSVGTAAADSGAGTVNATTGYYVAGTAGFSGTKTVRAAGGAADCTLIFSGGLLVAGGTC